MSIQPRREMTVIPDKTFPINVFHIRSITPHWHDHLEWIYVQNGAARVQIDGDFVRLERGEFAFVHAKQVHAATSLDANTALVAIVFNEALVRNSGLDNTEERYFSPFLRNKLQIPNFLKAADPLIEDIRSAFLRIMEEFEQNQLGYELFIKAELFRTFGLIFRHYESIIAHARGSRPKTADFTSLLGYLRTNYAAMMRIHEAAKMVNMSPNHFCKTFKQLTGKTFIEYLHMLKVTEAERLLLESDLAVTDIATKVGFNNLTYFGRVFKKYKNQTPSDVRKQRAMEIPSRAAFLLHQ
ncbi:helix-turn-helix domain-containing protein [Alicyclobacillus fodiniaquatilis]|uniref:AraC family transcriptional regulator n=1 Tax=Alicyclobacillus fodiniaquatilis TaxID=1661150 RepID=A0ABW4JNJ8_9BACL